MENSSNDSFSDKDKKMSERFEFAKDSEKSKEKEKKDTNKIPKRSLFLSKERNKELPEKIEGASTASEWLQRQQDRAKERQVILDSVLKGKGGTDKETKYTSESDSEPEETERTINVDSIEDSPKVSDETKVNVDEITPADKQQDSTHDEFKKVILEKRGEVEADLEDVNSPQEAKELTADASFLSKVGKQLAKGTSPNDAIDSAFEETVEETVVGKKGGSFKSQLTDDGSADKLREKDHTVDVKPMHTSKHPRPVAAATAKSIASSSQPTSVPYYSPNVSPTAPPRRGRAAFPSPVGSSTISALNSPSRNSNALPPIPNVIAANTPNTDPNLAKMNEFYYRRKNTGKVILSGLLGYAVGRRGGRKRTEARLQPEIEEGKQNISSLQQKLETSEKVVREKAAESQRLKEKLSEQVEQPESAVVNADQNVEKAPDTEPTKKSGEAPIPQHPSEEKIVEKAAASLAAGIPKKPEAIPAATTEKEVQEIEAQREKYIESLLSENKSPEEDTVQPKASSSEESSYEKTPLQNQGSITETKNPSASAEKPASAEALSATPEPLERQKKTVEQRPNQQGKEHSADIQTMTMPEVLQVAEKIDTGFGSLREMYEQKRIDAVNLRKVVVEHSAGRSYKEFLNKSLEAEEMKRELRNETKTDDSTGGQIGAAHSIPSSHTSTGGGASRVDGDASSDDSAQATPSVSDAPQTVHAFQSRATQSPQTYKAEEVMNVSTPIAIGLGIFVGGIFALLVLVFSGSI